MSEPPTDDLHAMVALIDALTGEARRRSQQSWDDPARREKVVRAHAAADSRYVNTRNAGDNDKALTWTEAGFRRGVWTSDNGVFSVVRVNLPTRKPDFVYVVLQRDPEGAAAWGPDYAGYAAHVTCTVGYAMDDADRRDWRNRHPGALSVPEDYADTSDALTVNRFFWPISEGTSRGALVTELDKHGHLWARIIGMSRTTGDEVEPGEFTSVDVTRAVFANTPLRLMLRLLARRLAREAYAPYGKRRAIRRAKRAIREADRVFSGLGHDPGALRGGLELRPITVRSRRARARRWAHRWAARLNIRRGTR